MVRDVGQLLGPACAAGLLLLAGPELVLGLNAITFAISAVPAAARCAATSAAPAGAGPTSRRPPRALAGIGTVVRDPRRPHADVLLRRGRPRAGTMNVAELVLAQQELGSGRAGFALLVSAYGCGLIAGSLLGARDDGDAAASAAATSAGWR